MKEGKSQLWWNDFLRHILIFCTCTCKNNHFIWDSVLVHLAGPVHRCALCQCPFRWIYYYDSNKYTGKETDKMHLCAVCEMLVVSWRTSIFQVRLFTKYESCRKRRSKKKENAWINYFTPLWKGQGTCHFFFKSDVINYYPHNTCRKSQITWLRWADKKT